MPDMGCQGRIRHLLSGLGGKWPGQAAAISAGPDSSCQQGRIGQRLSARAESDSSCLQGRVGQRSSGLGQTAVVRAGSELCSQVLDRFCPLARS